MKYPHVTDCIHYVMYALVVIYVYAVAIKTSTACILPEGEEARI